MTTRRIFLGGAFAAASAVTLAGLAHAQSSGAQGSGRTVKIRTGDGAELFVKNGIKQGVLGDRNAYLAGLLKDVFFDAGRPATNPVTQATIDAALAMAMQASVTATTSSVDAFSQTDFRAELASVKVPTLVLHGTADIPVPFVMAKAMAAGIAQSKLIEYRDASHGIVVTERDRVTRDLQAFIAI